jgi:hypothetical protein
MRAGIAACAVTALALSPLSVPHPAGAGGVRHDRMVADAPASGTPEVLDGEVRAVALVGNRIVVGGNFTQVRDRSSGAVLDRAGLFAFAPGTGAVEAGFAPGLGGRVDALAGTAGGEAVFVGGRFPLRLAKLDLDSGQRVAGFRATVDGSSVEDLAVSGGRLYVGGGFSAVNGVPRSSLAALHPATGSVDPRLDVPFTAPRQGRLRVEKLDVTPDGSRLVAAGTFTRAAGQERHQLAVVDVGATPARLADWHTDAYRMACSPSFDTYVRDVAVAPGGDWFVVVTTGARSHTSLCDSAARFELTSAGRGLRPTWVDHSGGDSFTAVTVTGPAVYVGGHMRWMNNPWSKGTGRDAQPGPGAVSRSGIAALDPANGLPLSWDPGREPRGQGAFALVPGDDGLWVGSDTEYLAGQRRPRLAFLPLAGGRPVPEAPAPRLPGHLYQVALEGGLRKRSFDGRVTGPEQDVGGGRDWSGARGAFLVGETLYTGWEDGRLLARRFEGDQAGEPRSLPLQGLGDAGFPAGHLSGAFYDQGRLYYTVAGDPRLRYRYFTPESGVVGAEPFVVSGEGDGMDWSETQGLTLAGGHLYLAAGDGTLRQVAFQQGHPLAGTESVVDRGSRWGNRGLFVS